MSESRAAALRSLLFASSAAENIRYGKLDATDAELQAQNVMQFRADF